MTITETPHQHHSGCSHGHSHAHTPTNGEGEACESKCPMGKMAKILAPFALVPLRLTVGTIFIAHGLQKCFGMFDGPGIQNFASVLASLHLPFPLFQAYLAGYSELLGGLMVAVGLLTRFGALALAGTMVVAIATVHLQGGLFAQNNGFEYPLVLLGACLTLFLTGAGPVSLDGVKKTLSKR